MPILNPMNYSCKECGWSAVKMEGDLKLTSPGPRICPSCGGKLVEKLGSFLDMLNPVKRVRGVRLDFQQIRKS